MLDPGPLLQRSPLKCDFFISWHVKLTIIFLKMVGKRLLRSYLIIQRQKQRKTSIPTTSGYSTKTKHGVWKSPDRNSSSILKKPSVFTCTGVWLIHWMFYLRGICIYLPNFKERILKLFEPETELHCYYIYIFLFETL